MIPTNGDDATDPGGIGWVKEGSKEEPMAGGRYRDSHNVMEPGRVRMDGTTTKTNDKWEPPKGGKRPNTAYEKYKENLHAMFDGNKPMPEKVQDLLATRPGAEDRMAEIEAKMGLGADKKKKKKGKKAAGNGERRTRRTVGNNRPPIKPLLDAIRGANTQSDISTAVAALFATGHSLPADDEDVLSKVIGTDNDDVVLQALDLLATLIEEDESGKSRTLLKSRLENAALMGSSAVSSRCDEVRKLIG
jgi:hypothetical protein